MFSGDQIHAELAQFQVSVASEREHLLQSSFESDADFVAAKIRL